MKEYSTKQLLANYLLGICTTDEKAEIEDWLSESESNIQTLQQVARKLSGEQLLLTKDKEQIKRNIFSERSFGQSSNSNHCEISHTHLGRYQVRRPTKAFYKKVDFWTKAAAVFLVLILAASGAYYYSHSNTTPQKPSIVWLTKALPYGQTATLRFGDGSTIKLNGGSTLRYPSRFSGESRVVYLEGEAFFTIAHDEDWPFVVHARSITIHDIGTSFNIEAYQKSEEIQVVVAEGTVAVAKDTADSSVPSIILEKNQWVTYRKGTSVVEKGEGEIWKKIAWKNDVLVFDSEPFSVVATKLERWYGVEIVIKDKALANMIVEGAYDDANLNHVLESVQFILGAEYTINDNVVTFQLPDEKGNITKHEMIK